MVNAASETSSSEVFMLQSQQAAAAVEAQRSQKADSQSDAALFLAEIDKHKQAAAANTATSSAVANPSAAGEKPEKKEYTVHDARAENVLRWRTQWGEKQAGPGEPATENSQLLAQKPRNVQWVPSDF